MKRTRRNHGAAFKAQVAFAAFKGDKTLARAANVFGGTKHKPDEPDLKSLHAKIGQLTLEHDG